MQTKILLVEDEAITAMDIKRMLEILGFEVVGIASRGEEAIKKAQEFKPDIILMDIILKGDMDGVEASNAIQELLDIPIIYMSAFSDKETFKRAKLTKPYGFLTKPINYDGLSVSIETAIYKHDLDKKLAENEKKLKDAYESIDILNKIVIAANNSSDINFLSKNIFDISLDLLNFDSGVIYLIDGKSRTVKALSSYVAPEEVLKKLNNVKIDEYPQKTVYIDGKSLYMNEGEMNPPEIAIVFGFNSMAMVPIFSQEKIIGSLNLASKNIHNFNKEEKNLIESIGREIGSTITRLITENKLKQINDTLELKVRERTSELENAYAEISDLYNKAPCGYHSLDKDGYFVKINDTELSWLGYSREEIIGKKNVIDLFTEESVEKFNKIFPVFKDRGYAYDQEFDMIRKDGTILPILVNATAIKDSEGNYLMSRSSLFDISKRKNVENALGASEKASKEHIKEIDAIYNSAHVGLCVLDQELRYKRINGCMAELNGIPPEEHLGKTVGDIVPDLAEEAEKIAKKIFETGEPVLDIELKGTTEAIQGVSRTWIEQWIPLKDDNGKVTGINIVAMEVTENRQKK